MSLAGVFTDLECGYEQILFKLAGLFGMYCYIKSYFNCVGNFISSSEVEIK